MKPMRYKMNKRIKKKIYRRKLSKLFASQSDSRDSIDQMRQNLETESFDPEFPKIYTGCEFGNSRHDIIAKFMVDAVMRAERRMRDSYFPASKYKTGVNNESKN